jgi:NAD(P)H-dependent flavin oxidoreductase YrpB (nitropropane dioxygenase family)
MQVARTHASELFGIERWLGRGDELRRHRTEVSAQLRQAERSGDPDRGAITIGHTAGLIERLEPAADVVRRISRDDEAILRHRLPGLLAQVARAASGV